MNKHYLASVRHIESVGKCMWSCIIPVVIFSGLKQNLFYYLEESVLLGTTPLVDSIPHSIRDPSGVFSVCHAFECHNVQWRHDSRLFYFVEWIECVVASVLFRIMAVASRFVLLNDDQVRVANTISHSFAALTRFCVCHSNIKFISSRHRVISSIYRIPPPARPRDRAS